jgi:hypothetical protein
MSHSKDIDKKRLLDAANRLQAKRNVTAPAQQLPLWSQDQRGLPNPFARSALFTAAGKKEPRQQLQREKIAATHGSDLYYTGQELRQDDEDVFLQAAHLVRFNALNDGAKITGGQFLASLKWGRSKNDYERLRESLLRLAEGSVIVMHPNGRKGFTGGLLRKIRWSDDDDADVAATNARTEWTIFLEPEIINLFASDGYTLIDWDQRLSLTPLAKWLHSFYFTHRAPFDYKVATLYELCGSQCKELRAFRYLLKKALTTLKECGFLVDWAIDPTSDLVTVIRAKDQPAALA